MTVCPAKTQISLGIRPVWSVFAVHMKKPLVLGYPVSAQWRLWSDWADAQADLSLCWVHRSFCWFCRAAAHLAFDGQYKSIIKRTQSKTWMNKWMKLPLLEPILTKIKCSGLEWNCLEMAFSGGGVAVFLFSHRSFLPWNRRPITSLMSWGLFCNFVIILAKLLLNCLPIE